MTPTGSTARLAASQQAVGRSRTFAARLLAKVWFAAIQKLHRQVEPDTTMTFVAQMNKDIKK